MWPLQQDAIMAQRAHLDAYQQGLSHSAHGRHALAIASFERALAAQPNDMRVLFALGNTARELGLSRPAEAFYRRVLAREPDRLEAIVNLANLLRAEGRFADARRLVEAALVTRARSAELWLTLGAALCESGEPEQAGDCYRKALDLRPDYSPALGNLADLLADDGRIEEALSLYGRLLRKDSENAQARLNRSILHLRRGDLKAGWRDYEARLCAGKAPRRDHRIPRWKGDPLQGQTLLVMAEQGIGDQIMFASMIADLSMTAHAAGGCVILECEPRLEALFARSFPLANVHGWDSQTLGGKAVMRYGWLEERGGATRAIEMGSLPLHLRPDFESFSRTEAYLVPDAAEVARWRSEFANLPRPVLGICWRSGGRGGHRALQYAPLEAWADFVRDWPGSVVCAQYGAETEEISQLESMSGKRIVRPPGIDQKNELDRACALLCSLDAVVSAPTAVSWLAAAAGVFTAKILYSDSWTSFGRDREPFAPACICCQPRRRGDWKESFARAQEELSRRLSGG
jgi:tetratricopeptide (TPR) repeat protein